MVTKIIILGFCVSIISIILKQYQYTFSVVVNVIFVISVALLIFESAADSFRSIYDLLDKSSSSGRMLTGLCKAAAVCLTTGIASDITKESGNTAISDMIDLGGRVMLLIISLPYIESIIKTATAFVS